MTPQEIKDLRATLHLSTAELGEMVGVSGRTIEDWEQKGRQSPKGAALKMLELIKKEKCHVENKTNILADGL